MIKKDEKELRSLLESFVQAWVSGETACLDDIMLDDCLIDFSIFEKNISHENFKKELTVRTRKPTYTRFDMYNYFCSIGKNKAQQIAIICGLFVDDSQERLASFAFSGMMVNTLIRTTNGWKYSAMRLDLGSESDNHGRLYSSGIGIDYYDGDTSFVQNWNLLTNTVGWHKGMRLPSIIPEYDAPWYAITDRVNTDGTDEEKIREAVCRYCFSMDYDALELYDKVWADDAHAIYRGAPIYDKRTVTALLKHEKEGGIGTGHILVCDTIDIHGDTADVHVYRAGTSSIPWQKLIGEDKKKYYAFARYDLKMIKDNENNIWRIFNMLYYEGGVIERPSFPGVFSYSIGN